MSDVTLRRVGHKGADHIAPGNTTASFDAALAAAVDMIEFDVLPRDLRAPDSSELVLAHEPEHVTPASLSLEQGLTLSPRPSSPRSSSTSTSSSTATSGASSKRCAGTG